MLKLISVIIPVFNEDAYIAKTLEAVAKTPVGTFHKEIIVVNDGSTDATAAVIKKTITRLSKKPSTSTYIVLHKKKNEGKTSAVKAGIMKSHGDVVIIQDADLEYSPGDYEYMLEPVLEYNADAVYGSRFVTQRPRRVLYFSNYLGNVVLTFVSNLKTGLNLTDMETGLKAFRGPLIRSLAPTLRSSRFGFEPEITLKLAKISDIRIFEVGISYNGRTYTEGKKIRWVDGLWALWELLKG